MMLWFTKKGMYWLKNQREHKWSRAKVDMLSAKTMGIVGYGDIGMECARVASQGFGARVIGLKRDPNTATEEQR